LAAKKLDSYTQGSCLVIDPGACDLTVDVGKEAIRLFSTEGAGKSLVAMDLRNIQNVDPECATLIKKMADNVSGLGMGIVLLGDFGLMESFKLNDKSRIQLVTSLDDIPQAQLPPEHYSCEPFGLAADFEAVTEGVFKIMIDQPMEAVKMQLRSEYDKNFLRKFEFGASAGIAGASAQFFLIISFSKESLLGVMSTLHQQEETELTHEILVGPAEILNVISGSFLKRAATERNLILSSATPNAIIGHDSQIQSSSKYDSLVTQCRASFGEFLLELVMISI